MNSNVKISPITVKDLAELRTVALHAYRDHYLHLWYDVGEWYIEKSFSAGRLSAELDDPNARFYLIYLEEEAAGFLKLNVDAPLDGFQGPNALELERIDLTKTASGKGVWKRRYELCFWAC